MPASITSRPVPAAALAPLDAGRLPLEAPDGGLPPMRSPRWPLHGEDLTGFVNAPARRNAARIPIGERTVQGPGTGGILRFWGNLMVECEPSWVTAKPGAATEKKP